jgi:hypothetical protein
MLAEIGQYLALSKREKPLYSTQARLQSIIGQYRGQSRDICDALRGYVQEGQLKRVSARDRELEEVIRLVRSRFMP